MPFLSFKRIVESPTACASVVKAEQFEIDRASGKLPDFAFYSPDMCNSGHGSGACSFGSGEREKGLKAAAAWIDTFVATLRNDTESWRGTLLIITFDESDPRTDASRLKKNAKTATIGLNHIYTVFLGDMVRSGDTLEGWVGHFDVLRTIGYVLGLEPVGPEDTERKPITTIWK